GDGFTPTAWPVLADGRVNFCGEAVAAVVATNAYVVADACERVRVEYEPLPAIASIEAALAADRVLYRRRHRQGDVDGACARAPGEVGRGAAREPRRGVPGPRPADGGGGRGRVRRCAPRPPGARGLRRRRVPHLPAHGRARAAGERGDPAGPVPHAGLRVG